MTQPGQPGFNVSSGAWSLLWLQQLVAIQLKSVIIFTTISLDFTVHWVQHCFELRSYPLYKMLVMVSHSLSLLWEFVLLHNSETAERPSLYLILQPTIYCNTCHYFFFRLQWRMLWKHRSKLFLVQENFEHNTWYCWEWQVTVVAHFVLSNLLGNCLSLHHSRNWNHREGMERVEKKVITPWFEIWPSRHCFPHKESFPHLPHWHHSVCSFSNKLRTAVQVA